MNKLPRHGISVTAEESLGWRVNMAASEEALPESCILSIMASLIQNIFAVSIFFVMARYISIVHTFLAKASDSRDESPL